MLVIETKAVINTINTRLVDLNYSFDCDWLIEPFDNKLSNNKLSHYKMSGNKLSDNNLASMTSEFVGGSWKFL